jgi:hypothetical protein
MMKEESRESRRMALLDTLLILVIFSHTATAIGRTTPFIHSSFLFIQPFHHSFTAFHPFIYLIFK